MKLHKALSAWKSADFDAVVKDEIERLAASSLPLQQGMSHSSYVSDEGFSVMINRVVDDAATLRVTAGVFYRGVIAGCSCADDPSPIDTQPEYCELEFAIDKTTAETSVRLIAD